MKYGKNIFNYLRRIYDENNPKKVKLIESIIHKHLLDFIGCKEISGKDLTAIMSYEDMFLNMELIRQCKGEIDFSIDYLVRCHLVSKEFLSLHWKEALADTDERFELAEAMSISDILDNLQYFNYSFTKMRKKLDDMGASPDNILELAKRLPKKDVAVFPDYALSMVRTLVGTYRIDESKIRQLILAREESSEIIERIINCHDDWDEYVDYRDYIDLYIDNLYEAYHIDKGFTEKFISKNGYYYFYNYDTLEKAAKKKLINNILTKVSIRELKGFFENYAADTILDIITENGGDIGIIERRLTDDKAFKTLHDKVDLDIAEALLNAGRKGCVDARTFYKAAMRIRHYFTKSDAELFR